MCFFFVLDPLIKDHFLMGSMWPATIILLLYLLFIFKIGPAFMKYRQPFAIDNILLVYNSVQVLLNAYIFIEVREHFKIKRIKIYYGCVIYTYINTYIFVYII